MTIGNYSEGPAYKMGFGDERRETRDEREDIRQKTTDASLIVSCLASQFDCLRSCVSARLESQVSSLVSTTVVLVVGLGVFRRLGARRYASERPRLNGWLGRGIFCFFRGFLCFFIRQRSGLARERRYFANV